MHDELERTAESPAVSSARLATAARLEMLDVAAAITIAERAAGSRLLGDPSENGDLGRAFGEAAAIAEKGERVAIIAPAERLTAMRDPMRRIANSRVGLVAHAIAGHGAEELAALTDLGWGVLCASGPEDSFDLTLIARRASEDCGVPFVVVHALGRATHPAGRAVAMVGVPQDKAIQSFVGPRVKIEVSGSRNAGDRAIAERVPFALGAALREYGSVSGRRHDAFDKIPLGESPLVLVGTGPIGDALFCATHELRARGYDVGAVHLTALRPFPGPRLVKTLARALAVTVLEPADEPLTHGALLARDVKSAFTDALTWVPGFPGIGRIPKLFVGAAGSAFDLTDLAAVCENMLADERGRRIFSFVDVEHALPRPTKPVASTPAHAPSDRAVEREVAIRVVLDDVASANAVLDLVGGALAAGVGLRTHGIVTTSAAGTVVDLLASRDHARGGMARRRPRLVIATERGVTSVGAVVGLQEPIGTEGSAILGVIGADSSGVLPEAVRTIVRERRARVLPLSIGDGPTGPGALAAVVAGAILAAASRATKTPLDGGAAARIIGECVAAPDAEIAGQRARRAFESARDLLSAVARDTDPDASRPIGVA
jgi:pyruvate ferredoxin oxidoreductase alpha subunit